MVSDDQDRGYFLARQADELDSAFVARDEAARRVHARLAQLYAEQARATAFKPTIVVKLDAPFVAAASPRMPELDMGRGSREQGFGQRGCR